MNSAIKLFSSALVVVVLSFANATGQTTDKANAPRQAKTDTAKPGHTTAEASAREATAQSRKAQAPSDEPAKEEKKWGLQVVTGEKWYQVSIKLVM